MIEQPEVVMASEVKTAAESAVKQARTLLSGLLQDCQFPSVENKNRRKRLDLNCLERRSIQVESYHFSAIERFGY